MPGTQRFKERRWFELWVRESYTIRQLAALSGHSPAKLKRIKNIWLEQEPVESFDYARHRYLLFDGTYFHKNGCLITFMDSLTHRIIFNAYVDKEGYHSVRPFLLQLKTQGLSPVAITVDGHIKVLRALREVWPRVRIQRCLYHIQREGLRWLRTSPKTQAARDLRALLGGLHRIQTTTDQQTFRWAYRRWLRTYRDFIQTLPNTSVAFKDLKRTVALIRHALPDMFRYLKDPRIRATTNLLESFYSRLKADFRRHRGLSETHKRAYLRWYCYFKNQKITNTA